MTHELTSYDDDDGMSEPSRSTRGGNYLKYDPVKECWRDRDGCEPPQPLVVIKLEQFLRRWTDKGPIDLVDRPLPDLDELNAAIPQAEWQEGLDGQRRPPWSLHAGFYMVDPATAQRFVYASSTVGAHISFGELKDSVATMRALRGEKCVPIVELASKPMPTRYNKTSTRPYFEIIRRKLLGGEIPASAPALRIEVPKASVDLGAETLAVLGDVKPPTPAEIIDDDFPEIPF